MKKQIIQFILKELKINYAEFEKYNKHSLINFLKEQSMGGVILYHDHIFEDGNYYKLSHEVDGK